jgi:hypothetical protein
MIRALIAIQLGHFNWTRPMENFAVHLRKKGANMQTIF